MKIDVTTFFKQRKGHLLQMTFSFIEAFLLRWMLSEDGFRLGIPIW